MNEHALDALLAEYAPPMLPAGLAGRIAAAAVSLPQAPRPAAARRMAAWPGRDRRGPWRRRPILLAGIALGLAVSGAVAATLAGVRIDRLPMIHAVLSSLPFGKSEAPAAAPPPRPAPAHGPPPVAATAPNEEPPVVDRNAAQAPAQRALAPADPAPPAESAPPAAAPVEAPRRPESASGRPVDISTPSPSLPTEPAPVARAEDRAPVAEPSRAVPAADEQMRLQRDQIERAEQLRAVRQMRIERSQRLQQSRERMRRLRRD